MDAKEQARLEDYFWKLEGMLPNPPKDWAKSSKPCKWLKIIEEKNKTNATKETG